MQAEVRAFEEDGVTVVAVEGEIDLATVGVLDAMLGAAVAGPAPRIVVDLADVRFMDSAGLRVLLRAQDRLAVDGRRLVARHPGRPVQRLIDLAGAERLCAA